MSRDFVRLLFLRRYWTKAGRGRDVEMLLSNLLWNGLNPFNASWSKLLLFEGSSAILVQPTINNFRHSGALALSPERQSARMSKIINGGLDQYGKV